MDVSTHSYHRSICTSIRSSVMFLSRPVCLNRSQSCVIYNCITNHRFLDATVRTKRTYITDHGLVRIHDHRQIRSRRASQCYCLTTMSPYASRKDYPAIYCSSPGFCCWIVYALPRAQSVKSFIAKPSLLIDCTSLGRLSSSQNNNLLYYTCSYSGVRNVF